MPSGPRIGRRRWPRPSQFVTWPSFSMKAAAGRNASANGLEVPQLERLHHLDRHVLQCTARERRVGSVAQRVDADQEQHVDLAIGARPQDRVRVAARLAVEDRPPRGLDLAGIADRPAAREQRRVHPGPERPAVVRAPRDVGDACAGGRRLLERRVGHPRPLARDHDRAGPGIPERGERLVHHGIRATSQEARLVSGRTQDVRREVVQPRATRVQHPDLRPAGRGLSQAAGAGSGPPARRRGPRRGSPSRARGPCT